jgi:hypothetical protein
MKVIFAGGKRHLLHDGNWLCGHNKRLPTNIKYLLFGEYSDLDKRHWGLMCKSCLRINKTISV